MYIEYITPQRVADRDVTTFTSLGGPYRPTWLIRVSDWQKVPGSEATNGYCTLSYCWEQSGEKIQTSDGEYDLLDRGRHKITTKYLEKRKTRRSVRYQWKKKSKLVTFDALLYKICKEFNVDYLWYDKVCINQLNKVEKHGEIKNMHHIYSNARFTVALVPEIYIDDVNNVFKIVDWVSGNTEAKQRALDDIQASLWWRRSWTLEELMMSTRILIVGTDTHLWCLAEHKQTKEFKENDFISNDMLGFKEKKNKSANQVLSYAHFRTSTKEHDKIYALSNIFDGMADIEVDYHSDVSVAMNAFYRQISERDLSVMCFGSNLNPEGGPKSSGTMKTYGLPSWTGIDGLHAQYYIRSIVIDQNGKYIIDDTMHLHINCRHYTLSSITKYKDYEVFKDDERGLLADSNYERVITSIDDFDNHEKPALDWGIWTMHEATSCLSTHFWKPDHPAFEGPHLSLSLTEDCSECIIPAMIFESVRDVVLPGEEGGEDIVTHYYDYLVPVLKKSEKNVHKAIGIMLVKHIQYDEDHNTPVEFLDELFSSLGGTPDELVIN